MNINSRIETIIESSGLSHAEFSEKIEVQRSSISHILSGRNKPSLDFLRKVKDAFPNLSWDWVIEGRGEMYLPTEKQDDSEKNNTTPLPDLFSFVSTETEEQDNTDEKLPLPNRSESRIDVQSNPKSVQSKNLPLEISNPMNEKKYGKTVQKVILLYEDGRFESFEP